MSLKNIVLLQYQSILDRAAEQLRDVSIPTEGWLRTARKALNMSGAQLARRMGVTRALVSRTEKNELSGGVTLKTMQHMAEAMGYRFVYAIVPETSVHDMVAKRAREKAEEIVHTTSMHMALEAQTLSDEQIEFEIERIQRRILDDMPADLWDDKHVD